MHHIINQISKEFVAQITAVRGEFDFKFLNNESKSEGKIDILIIL